VVTFPTATSPLVGPWVLGVLVNNVWSVAGGSSNTFLLQYSVNLNFPSGWYVSSGSVIPANWKASPGQRWVVPFGAGAGKIVWVGGLPFNCSLAAFVNAVKPDFGPTWSLRAQRRGLGCGVGHGRRPPEQHHRSEPDRHGHESATLC